MIVRIIAFVSVLIASLPLRAELALIPAPPKIAASSYILMDANSGYVITQHNADEPLPPASLTKLMTSYVLSYELERGHVDNDEMVTISRRAWAQNPVFAGSSLMWIEVGKKVSVGDLHKGIVISSGNDATVAIAEHLAGSEEAFADIMNQHAKRLGMANSHFVNSHGLPHPDHQSSARDLALLSQAILQFPKEYALYSQKEFTYNNIRQTNRNRLLWSDPSVDGLKTGHTTRAGYCLVTSAKRDGMRLISVVMGADSESSRERETQKLLSYGYRYFETHKLYEEQQELTQHKLWKGAKDQVTLGVADTVYLTIPRGSHDQLKAELVVDDMLQAPVERGQQYGQLVVELEGETLLTRPLIALESVEQGSLFKRLWDSIVLFVLDLIQ